MSKTQLEKAEKFQQLHHREAVLLIANAWDMSSALLLAGLGFEAIATSSGASAATLGRRDGEVTREEALQQAEQIASAVNIPVSLDLEKGFGDDSETVAETIRRAAKSGAVGGSIEDATRRADNPIYEITQAVDRVAAAVEAARSLPFPFTLTARAENFIFGNPDLDDTIRRLQAFETAGADVLFAPGLPDLEAVHEVCSALKKPVNFMVGIKGASFTVRDLEAAGVKRISFASSLYRAAMAGLLQAAREIREKGSFTYVDTMLTTADLLRLFDSAR